jgi:hypothetical protein
MTKQRGAPTIEQVRTRFERWRKGKRGRSVIPEELWAAAIAVARRDGVNRTAAALRLDGGKLKRRMDQQEPRTSPRPAFVQLPPPAGLGVQSGASIEVETDRGRLGVYCQDTAEVARVSRLLWELLASS